MRARLRPCALVALSGVFAAGALAPPGVERLWIYAGELPIGSVEVSLRPAPLGGGHVRYEGNLSLGGTGVSSPGRFRLEAECEPDGRIRSLLYVSKDGPPPWMVRVEDGWLRTPGPDVPLPRGAYGIACLLLRRDRPGSRTMLEPALYEESGLLGRVELSVHAEAGARRLVSRFTDPSGLELVEEAVVAADGRLLRARSFSTAIRYEPSPAHAPLRAPAHPGKDAYHVAFDPAGVEAMRVNVAGEERTARRSPPLPAALHAHAVASMEAARARWASVPGATCVDLAGTAHETLLARRVEARLVTGWVVVDAFWRLHRWVELRHGDGWIAIDPALGQLAPDASHVPILAHGTTPADRTRVEVALAAAWPRPPIIEGVDR